MPTTFVRARSRWSASTFVLRKGMRFHNGEPVTAEDVKFSWDRYEGAGAKLLHDKVKEVVVEDLKLKQGCLATQARRGQGAAVDGLPGMVIGAGRRHRA